MSNPASSEMINLDSVIVREQLQQIFPMLKSILLSGFSDPPPVDKKQRTLDAWVLKGNDKAGTNLPSGGGEKSETQAVSQSDTVVASPLVVSSQEDTDACTIAQLQTNSVTEVVAQSENVESSSSYQRVKELRKTRPKGGRYAKKNAQTANGQPVTKGLKISNKVGIPLRKRYQSRSVTSTKTVKSSLENVKSVACVEISCDDEILAKPSGDIRPNMITNELGNCGISLSPCTNSEDLQNDLQLSSDSCDVCGETVGSNVSENCDDGEDEHDEKQPNVEKYGNERTFCPNGSSALWSLRCRGAPEKQKRKNRKKVLKKSNIDGDIITELLLNGQDAKNYNTHTEDVNVSSEKDMILEQSGKRPEVSKLSKSDPSSILDSIEKVVASSSQLIGVPDMEDIESLCQENKQCASSEAGKSLKVSRKRPRVGVKKVLCVTKDCREITENYFSSDWSEEEKNSCVKKRNKKRQKKAEKKVKSIPSSTAAQLEQTSNHSKLADVRLSEKDENEWENIKIKISKGAIVSACAGVDNLGQNHIENCTENEDLGTCIQGDSIVNINDEKLPKRHVKASRDRIIPAGRKKSSKEAPLKEREKNIAVTANNSENSGKKRKYQLRGSRFTNKHQESAAAELSLETCDETNEQCIVSNDVTDSLSLDNNKDSLKNCLQIDPKTVIERAFNSNTKERLIRLHQLLTQAQVSPKELLDSGFIKKVMEAGSKSKISIVPRQVLDDGTVVGPSLFILKPK